jgi:hypothetical protein
MAVAGEIEGKCGHKTFIGYAARAAQALLLE